MITFNDIKPVICRSCFAQRATNIEDKYHFNVDFRKLNRELRRYGFTVMSFEEATESKPITFSDLPLLSEYAKKQEDTSRLFLSGNTEFVSFMLCYDKEGEIKYHKEDGEEIIDADELFDEINCYRNTPLISDIVNNQPCYRVVITKIFNYYKERFDYKIMFRSNNEMMKCVIPKFSQKEEVSE